MWKLPLNRLVRAGAFWAFALPSASTCEHVPEGGGMDVFFFLMDLVTMYHGSL